MFYIFVPEQHNEPEAVEGAVTAEKAALAWVQQFEMDRCNYEVASGRETMTVHVFNDEQYRFVPVELLEEHGGTVKWLDYEHFTFVVAGETAPYYYIERGKR